MRTAGIAALCLGIAAGVILLIAASSTQDATARPTITRVLFITGNVPPGTHESEMISVYNTGRNGYSQLADYLLAEQGHIIEQVNDLDPVVNPLREDHLKLYDLVVLGSNNRLFAAREAGALNAYVEWGGAVLALSDSRFGLSPNRKANEPGAGEISDNSLIEQYGMQIQHDNYVVVTADASRFVTPTHPLLSGVNSFKGEGVSLIKRLGPPAQILVRGDGLPLTNGQITDNTYGITMFAQVGRGRVAAVFDRNTWFNAGVGSDGTDISELDNRRYAYAVFDWLARTGREDRLRQR
ncbi:MAG TPA: DUF4350 domain-containing protein [Chloroflexia bacterium]|nr:DUF4350 domain-containing protein [Chloroflexia bacterium]